MNNSSIYLPEEEIGNLLWKNTEMMEGELGIEGTTSWFREYPIGKYRPDFVCFSTFGPDYEDGRHKNRDPEIHVVELKITADIYSVKQLATYLRFLKHCNYNWFYQNGFRKGFKIKGHLVARYFDISAIDTAWVCDMQMHRVIIPNRNEYYFDYEGLDSCPIDDGIAIPENLLRKFETTSFKENTSGAKNVQA